jgi:hypothetical protein
MPQKVRRAAANEMKIYSEKLPLITLKKTKTDFPAVKIEKSADAFEFVRFRRR